MTAPASRDSAARPCIEPDCSEPAGTPWTDWWCPSHDEERRARITAQLDAMDAALSGPADPTEDTDGD